MMTHILDCFAALCSYQQYRGDKKQSKQLNAKTQQAKNNAFKIAMSLMSRGMTHDDAEEPVATSALSIFLTRFPDDTKTTDGRSWMPLHWAVLSLGTPEGDQLSEEDVKLIYAIDPPALQRFHNSDQDHREDPDAHRYTPAHFLCIQPVTPLTLSLLRYFTMCNLQALISSTYTSLSVLHATCRYGQPTEELLHLLLQLDSSQVSKKCGEGLTPLEYLCANDCCNERLMNCLLQFDSSTVVVAEGIIACMNTDDHSSMLEKIDMLLKVNPEAAQHRFDSSQRNLLHEAAGQTSMPSTLCIDIMKRILVPHPDAVKEVSNGGWLPVHESAMYGCSLDVMEFLLGLYPESAAIVTGTAKNLLHLAVSYCSYDSDREAKVTYLCSRYPQFISQRDINGLTPLLRALRSCFASHYDMSAAKILCEVGGPELVRMRVIHPTSVTHSQNGRLPLHFFMSLKNLQRSVCSSFLSEEADFFRLMLRWYPEAAGIEAGNGTYKKTPYGKEVIGTNLEKL